MLWKFCFDFLINLSRFLTIRTMGAATDSYLTGEFKVAGKPAYLLIYTKSHPILKIETREKVYYYTARDGQETTKIYQEIKAKLP